MKLKYAYLLIAGLIIISSCKKDDDSPGEVIPPRTLSEVAIEDDAEIVEFLQTHFYNKEEFDAAVEGFDFKIKFDTIAGANSTKQSIYDSPFLILLINLCVLIFLQLLEDLVMGLKIFKQAQVLWIMQMVP